MKFLERQWYFKGEALAKHPMGKCVKSVGQSLDILSLVNRALMRLISILLGNVLVEEGNFHGKNLML